MQDENRKPAQPTPPGQEAAAPVRAAQERPKKRWQQPEFSDMRLGFEYSMYVQTK